MATLNYTAEVWKTIPFATEYEVSDMGRVRRAVARERCQAGRIIKTSLAGPRRNYEYVGFVHNDGTRRSMGMHRVVLLTFVGPCPGGHEGAHLDGNSLRNHLCNLAWKTAKANSADRTLHSTQTRGTKYSLGKLSDDAVRAIRTSKGSQSEIARGFGVSQSMIWKIKNGKAWAHVK